jgi:hypothetical protein
MNPVNLAYSGASGLRGLAAGMRGLVWVVVQLYEHPVIGIPVGILLICVLIFVVVRIVQRRRGSQTRFKLIQYRLRQ